MRVDDRRGLAGLMSTPPRESHGDRLRKRNPQRDRVVERVRRASESAHMRREQSERAHAPRARARAGAKIRATMHGARASLLPLWLEPPRCVRSAPKFAVELLATPQLARHESQFREASGCESQG